MAKFQVRIVETAVYVIAVEAENSESADQLACKRFTDSKDIREFFDSVDDRFTDLVLQVDDNGLPV